LVSIYKSLGLVDENTRVDVRVFFLAETAGEALMVNQYRR